MDKIETPEEFAQKIKDYCFDAWTMNREQRQYMGEFDLNEATRLITDFTALLRADERQKAAGWAREYLKTNNAYNGLYAAIMAEPEEAAK